MNRIAFFVLAAVISTPTYARWSDALPMVEPEDISMMKDAARVRMADQPVGTVLKWKNKKSGNKGTVELLDRFQRDGRECRTNKHIVTPRSEPTSQYVITICLTTDSGWQWSEPRPKKKSK